MNPRIESLEKLLGGPRDSALLRFSLGNEYLHVGDTQAAADCFRTATRLQPDYSAAWKALGKALAASGDQPAAMAAYREGIVIAEARGDIQAAKEMRVFLRRLEKPG